MVHQSKTNNTLVKEMLEAPLGQIATVLGNHLDCKVKLELIEQNTPKPGTKFERKVIVTGNYLPLIKATVKFDKKVLPEHITNQLLQKRILIGTILSINGIPNDKNVIFFNMEKDKISRTYQIKNNNDVLFEISEEIRTDFINKIRN